MSKDKNEHSPGNATRPDFHETKTIGSRTDNTYLVTIQVTSLIEAHVDAEDIDSAKDVAINNFRNHMYVHRKKGETASVIETSLVQESDKR